MARNIDRRLQSLNSRRRGTDRVSRITRDAAQEVLVNSLKAESYVARAPTQRNTRYVLGAMQAVSPDYTRISIEEAQRVGAQLKTGLAKQAIWVDFRLQGSVPCDIHIRGVSDVDLLVLDERYVHYDTSGIRSLRSGYASPVSYDTLQALQQLRRESEAILIAAFPAATVDTTGSKAINLSGGSLRRPVDVVPSNWFDTSDYQSSGAEADRGVHILNKAVPERVLNLPFRHIQRIGVRDAQCRGGMKKAIRLCKNVKADAIEEGTRIELSSFDLASALWHADLGALDVGADRELAILAEATRFLDFLARNLPYAATLQVPDGSRTIFNTAVKQEALIRMSLEMDDLALEVSREQAGLVESSNINSAQIADYLRRAYVPA